MSIAKKNYNLSTPKKRLQIYEELAKGKVRAGERNKRR